MNQTELKNLLGDTTEAGEKREWEVLQDWTRLGDEPSVVEEAVVLDKNSGEEHRVQRTAPEEAARLAAIEQVHHEARLALDDAEEERTAEGILWLAAVKEDPSLAELESLSPFFMNELLEQMAKDAEAAKNEEETEDA